MRNALKGITPTGAIWVIGLLDALAFVGGIALSFYKRVGFNASVSGSLFLVAAITFLGLLGLAQNMKQAPSSSCTSQSCSRSSLLASEMRGPNSPSRS